MYNHNLNNNAFEALEMSSSLSLCSLEVTNCTIPIDCVLRKWIGKE